MVSRKPARASYFPELTGLRAFAALLVFLHHFYAQWNGASGFWGFLNEYGREGYVGVSVFFALSGYLITRNYAARFAAGTIGYGDYWFRRFARIYPAYWALFVPLAVHSWDGWASFPRLLSNFTLTQGLWDSWKWTGIAPAWSLTIEESFYLLAPAVFVALAWAACAGRKRPGPGALRRQLAMLAAVAAAAVGLGYALPAIKPPGDFLANLPHSLIYTILGRLPEFAVGVAAALILGRAPAKATPGRRAADGAFLGSLLVMAASVAVLTGLRRGIGAYYGVHHPQGVWVFSGVALGTALLIASVEWRSRLASLALGSRPVEYLGRVSFVFYLLQDRFYSEPILKALDVVWPGGSKSGVLAYLALNLCAAAVHEAVEKPAHRWLTRK